VAEFLLKRAVATFLTLLGALVVVFLMVRLVPGDPALLYLGDNFTPEAYRDVRRALGLDRPIIDQLGLFLHNVMAGDFGASFRTHRPVLRELLEQFPYTIVLAVSGLLLAVAIGVPSGIVAALKRNRWADHLAMLVSLLGVTMPSFWLGILLLLLFSLHLGWLPTIGGGDFAQPVTVLQHAALPALTLGLSSAALIARLTRSAMLEVLNQDYVRTARAKGVRESRVVMRHSLRNAMIPILTIVGIDLGRMLAGTTVIEIVFSRPGVGHLLIEAMQARDYPQIQGAILFYITVIIAANTLVDVLYTVVDPRIRYA